MPFGLINFLHNYWPQPIIVQLGPVFIYWYGLLVMTAILVGLWLTIKLDKKYQLGLGQEKIFNLAIWLIIVGAIGARLYHVLSDINYYWLRPLEIFYLWRGGLGIFGAVIAGIIFLYFYARRQGWSVWLFLDLLAPAIILGEAIGRWGNWFNQENFGWPTNLSWGIPIDILHRPGEFLAQKFFHPTFLYQFFWNVIIFIFLLWLMKRWRPGTGMIVAFYLIFYSMGRFLIEFLRTNAQPMFFGLRLAQIVCLIFFLVGIIVLINRDRQKLSTGN